jgi:hypothetical protein
MNMLQNNTPNFINYLTLKPMKYLSPFFFCGNVPYTEEKITFMCTKVLFLINHCLESLLRYLYFMEPSSLYLFSVNKIMRCAPISALFPVFLSYSFLRSQIYVSSPPLSHTLALVRVANECLLY